MIILISIIYICLSVIYIRNEYKTHFITPLFMFLIMQLVMYIGIMIRCNSNNIYHIQLLALYLIALIGILLGAYPNKKYIQGINTIDLNTDVSQSQTIKIFFWAILSIVICSMFFRSVGFNAFSVLISGGINTDVSELRRSINYTSGSGIVYQFRVFILPILMFILISSTNRKHRIFGIVLAPLCILYLLGSGQRGGLVTVMLMYMVVFFYRNREIKKSEIDIKTYKGIKRSKRLIIIFLVAAAIAFGALTIGNRRIDAAGSLTNAIIGRIMVDNQGCALFGFENLVVREPRSYGYDWLMMTLELIPGVRTGYTATANRIFAMKYGSLRGTSPLCIWGSTFYNFGVVGVIVLSLLIGYLYSFIGRKTNQKVFSTVELVIYAELVVILGSWIAEGPYYLVNNGGVAIVLLYWVLIRSHVVLSIGKKDKNINSIVDTSDMTANHVTRQRKSVGHE